MACQIKAELRKRSNILESEGHHKAAYRDSEARKREGEGEGEGEAKVTTMVSGAIDGGNVQANNYFIA